MNAITQMTPVGIGAEWSPQWLLSAEQKALQADLIALCETTLRPNAIESDKGYVYPRKNFEALAAMGFGGRVQAWREASRDLLIQGAQP